MGFFWEVDIWVYNCVSAETSTVTDTRDEDEEEREPGQRTASARAAWGLPLVGL